jgi:hypothetical protein
MTTTHRDREFRTSTTLSQSLLSDAADKYAFVNEACELLLVAQ